MEKNYTPSDYPDFLSDIKERIRTARHQALRSVNKELITLYWDIGKAIVEKQETLGWGKSVVVQLSNDLQKEFPGTKGFSSPNLWFMRQFYIEYQANKKLLPLAREISWWKNVIIITKCKERNEKEFYLKNTKKFGWTKNVLILIKFSQINLKLLQNSL